MTLHATGNFCSKARSAALAGCAGALVIAAPQAAAQEDVTRTAPSIRDLALTPLTDLNLARDQIPLVLREARVDPYANDGLSDCMDIRRNVGDLDAVLGDDLDTAPPEQRQLTPTGVAQKVVGMLIPFRGVIREISGANEHEFEFREAIAAGLMRRAYLKGMGEQMGCPYPARPASSALIAQLEQDTRFKATEYHEDAAASAGEEAGFVSRPVVQGAN